MYDNDQWDLDVDKSPLASNSPSSLVFPDLDTLAIPANESILQMVIDVIKQNPSLAFPHSALFLKQSTSRIQITASMGMKSFVTKGN